MEQATPYSNLKIFAHSEVLNDMKNKKRVPPIYVRIKPTNYCNHRCYYCSYADSELGLRNSVNRQDQITWDKMQEIITDLADIGVKAVTFSGGGEPLLYPNIVDAMQKILDVKIDLSIITNGQLLKGDRAEVLKNAKWVRISFDSADAETYSKIRRVSIETFEELCNNISHFSRIKRSECELGINFVVNHENADQIYGMAKMVRELGANHIKYTARVTKELFKYHEPFKQNAIEQIHRAKANLETQEFKIINKYEGDFDSALIFQRTYDKCYVNRIFTVIAADSKVYFCHDKAYVKEGMVGDLTKQSFKDLWFSEETIKRYEEFQPRKECKHHCVYDDRNELLNTFYNLDQNHINFI